MAEDPKKPQTTEIEDWDNLPLDPNFDDWDDEPAAQTAPAELPTEEAAVPPAENKPKMEHDEDFDGPPHDDFDSPPPVATIDFETELAALTKDEDDSAGHNEEQTAAAPEAAAIPAEETSDPPGIDLTDDDSLLPKKVELDLDDATLPQSVDDGPEELDEPPVEESTDSPIETPPGGIKTEPETPQEVPVKKRRIPKLKMLIIIGPIVLVLFALLFTAYKLFFSASPEEESPPAAPLKIEQPLPPPLEPEPGELTLPPFFINLEAKNPKAPETVIELVVVLQYADKADEKTINNNIIVIRDIIFRLVHSKEPKLVGDSQEQSQLKLELTELINKALGSPIVTAVRFISLRTI